MTVSHRSVDDCTDADRTDADRTEADRTDADSIDPDHTDADRSFPGLTVLAEAAWPEPGDPPGVPGVAGFVISTFSPLIVAVTERCLTRFAGGPPLENGDRVAIILLSEEGDVGLASAVASAVDGDRRTGPVVFFQSVPSAVLGHVAERWALSGPLVSSNPVGDSLTDGRAQAALLIAEGAADAALIVVADQKSAVSGGDRAVALLVGRSQDEGWPTVRPAGSHSTDTRR